jgi:dCMP deaminase
MLALDSRPEFDTWALDLCELVARRSRDPACKVGAVIVRPDKTIASIGYNGFPRGVLDAVERYETREQKLMMVVHAEVNAIVTAREPLHGYTLYVSPMMPCAHCAGVIIQSGMRRVIARMDKNPEDSKWARSYAVTRTMFEEAEVRLELRRV